MCLEPIKVALWVELQEMCKMDRDLHQNFNPKKTKGKEQKGHWTNILIMLYLKFHQLHIITLTMLQKLSRGNMNIIVYSTTNRSTSRTHISHQELCHVSPGILNLKCCFSSTDGSYVQNQTKMSITKRVSYCSVSTMNLLMRVLTFAQWLLCTRNIFRDLHVLTHFILTTQLWGK